MFNTSPSHIENATEIMNSNCFQQDSDVINTSTHCILLKAIDEANIFPNADILQNEHSIIDDISNYELSVDDEDTEVTFKTDTQKLREESLLNTYNSDTLPYHTFHYHTRDFLIGAQNLMH